MARPPGRAAIGSCHARLLFSTTRYSQTGRTKKNATKRLYKAAKEGRKTVICVDEFGPLELRPYGGRSWQRKGRPMRFRATYHRPHGVRYFFGAYEVGSGTLWGHFTRRKRARAFLTFRKAIRRRYTGRIWIVLDNLSAHKTPEVMDYARRHNIRFQFTPTNASWLNRIECQFTHLKKNVPTHCDYETFDEMCIAIHKYLRWRNNNLPQLLFWKRHWPTPAKVRACSEARNCGMWNEKPRPRAVRLGRASLCACPD